ncbi:MULTISPECIES: DNA-protecting protein DprA [Yersinia]|uniref:DNA-protecting protein DprA n=2 Tax=Yersinia bercovieri TaxID=634 RepID=A0A2G4U1F9_YERBE|nr:MULTISPECIES: DNA-protecting protein DprA [Yersinia]EEQ07980.1 DNA protecting protein DprA [Yersinia bercovieri ATCC 43970]MCB5304072.1 DNA-protecting protein DprA [Yersinia bercovieri]MDN0104099.1 DNA-protecting protein DprA [Yersinia bercovieri]PHZ27123.1 DNA-protecting protein DprA [Yersinia bercovieri]QDW31826.1 DNA-protecting protein DprA [Yersinia sp. KBS0713]
MLAAELWLRMSKVKGFGVAKSGGLVRRLLASGDIHPGRLAAYGLSPQQCQQFYQVDPHYIEATLTWLNHPSHHLLTYGEPGYPPRLTHISGAPLVLFVSGELDVLYRPQVAMVGSRHFSHYGEQWGRHFASELARTGLVITSGLAMGIDGICHQAALSAKGKTIAVLGSGLENIYPRRHSQLAKEIEHQGGALVSEFLTTALPIAAHFPRRNRIISGLSSAVLVVEATMKSGSLITARYAIEQGRDVFALPGPLGSETSEGVHWLIQQGAYLASSVEGVAEQLGGSLQWISLPEKAIISSSERQVELPFADVLANVGDEVTPVDVVAERAGQPVPEIVSKLLELELAGWIAAVPGGYVRLRRAGHVRRFNLLI